MVYPAIPQIPLICLRNQNGAQTLCLVDALSANKWLCPMPIWYVTSYRHFHCSSIMWTCTSVCPVTLRCILYANGSLPPPTLLLQGSRGWRSWSLPNSVPIGPKILHSFQRGCCFVACFSLMRTGPNMCQLVSTLLATIYQWWNLGLSGEAMDPKSSILATNNWTQWRRPAYATGRHV